MKKKTQEQFLEELNNKYPNKFNTKEVKYVNNKCPVILTCKDCGFKKEYRPDTILNKRTKIGCFNCELINKKKRAAAKRNDLKDLIKKSIKVHGDKYDYSYVHYEAYNKKVKIKCKTCNYIFEQTFCKHISYKQGCPKCSGRVRSTKEAINIIKNMYGDIYIFNNFEYKNSTEKFKLICKKHNYEISTNFHRLVSSFKDRKCCPCEWQSAPNLYIKNILDKNNIENIPEYIFEDCKHINYLKFDFYLPKYNCVIEYQGPFHFKDIYGDLKLQQHRDEIKRNFCKKNNINELEVPYWDYKNIEKIISDKLNIKLIL